MMSTFWALVLSSNAARPVPADGTLIAPEPLLTLKSALGPVRLYGPPMSALPHVPLVVRLKRSDTIVVPVPQVHPLGVGVGVGQVHGVGVGVRVGVGLGVCVGVGVGVW